ncbi:hypothetical protein [Staphylococcus succinus]|uniref:Uncharacterized protein n=1 Tax=Staphylococcus succinus TaxID=61015 RepID=A0ABX5IKQ2_9STAP|nr:hypothetical protein [Staphylococcus succinus]PTI67656.1 hypothetical protein BU057_10410 [Staphylococcus succinus]RIN36688.1 hypothetical protein BU061_10940 [Staphylococcus succinus]
MGENNVNLDEIKGLLQELKENDGDQLNYEEVEAEIVDQKNTIRSYLMPDNQQEDERLKQIASKIEAHIQTGFETFNQVDEIINYLEPVFQRGKIDKVYGRAIVLIEENTLIEQVKKHFNNPATDYQLLDYVLSRAIELSNEIMPSEYTEILKLEKAFFEEVYNHS